MSGVITTGAHPKALWEGVHEWFGQEYNKHAKEYSQIFDMKSSKKKYEEDAETTGFGLAIKKPEATSVSYDSHKQGHTARYVHVTYGLGYIVTMEELDDNLYAEVSRSRASALAFSMRTTKEIVAANVMNRAFNPAYTGADGVEMISDAHNTEDGTQSNKLAIPADLSEAALEDLLIQIGGARNSRGLQIALRGMKLIIPRQLEFEAHRIMNSNLRVGTDFNDPNALRELGKVSNGICMNHYLTDPDAWFLKTDAPNGLCGFDRKEQAFTRDNDFDTENAKAKALARYSFGWTDFRGVFGSEGA